MFTQFWNVPVKQSTLLYLFKTTVEKSYTHTNTPARNVSRKNERFNSNTGLFYTHWIEMPPNEKFYIHFCSFFFFFVCLSLVSRLLLQFHIKIHSKSVNVSVCVLCIYVSGCYDLSAQVFANCEWIWMLPPPLSLNNKNSNKLILLIPTNIRINTIIIKQI